MSENGQLAVSVWVRLLKSHGLMLRQVRRRVPERLTLPQFDVLAQLHRRREGMTPGELTRELLVTAGNVTGIVARLTRLGLVERRPVPHDRRTLRVRLTPKGRQVIGRAIPRHRRDVAGLMAGLRKAEMAQLQELLGRLAHAVESRQARA
jgi:DNA-binding MarR family transcriptional regulator